ncbi:MAG: hypothetical protein WCJ39_10390 [bacterium]
MKTQKLKTLVIIAGASRGLSKTYFDYYSLQPNTQCIGISRTNTFRHLVSLDLLQSDKAFVFVKELNLSGIDRVIYIHGVGIDKFEPHGVPFIDIDGDGIDDEVYQSNVVTFLHLAEPLIARVTSLHIPLTICNIGSLGDIYNVPFWQSFTKSKNMLRKYMKSNTLPLVKSLFFNVSSTLDETGEKYGRPFADTTYWLDARDLVHRSVSYLDAFDLQTGHMELDFFNPCPWYSKDYFTNLPVLYQIWQRDMGYEGRDIPGNIRI